MSVSKMYSLLIDKIINNNKQKIIYKKDYCGDNRYTNCIVFENDILKIVSNVLTKSCIVLRKANNSPIIQRNVNGDIVCSDEVEFIKEEMIRLSNF